VDIQLFDQETGQRIIGWVAGDTSLRHPTTIEYRDMVFEYSGYLGVDGQPGHEVISIPGTTNRSLLMKAFGYASGMATVTYEWGEE
jgi:hypothetical protein